MKKYRKLQNEPHLREVDVILVFSAVKGLDDNAVVFALRFPFAAVHQFLHFVEGGFSLLHVRQEILLLKGTDVR